MICSVHVSSRIWSITRGGALRYTDTNQVNWHTITDLPAAPAALTACEEQQIVYTACLDGSIHALDPESGEIRQSSPEPLHDVPLCLLSLWVENSLFIGLNDGAVVRLFLNTLAFDCMLGNGVEHSAAVHALDADERFLYSGGEDATVLVWDLKEVNAVREISIPSAPIRSLLRVGSSLWTGLANGAVEIFDIFGESTNGIECISSQTPHTTPVVDLLKVGEYELWSLAFPRTDAQPSMPRSSKHSNVAVWDTRDFTFKMSDLLPSEDVLSITILERRPFEEVSIMALCERQGPQVVSTRVRGLTANEAVESSELRIMDLEQQLADASDEIAALRTSGYYVKTLDENKSSDDYPADEVSEVLSAPLRASSITDQEDPSRPRRKNDVDGPLDSENCLVPMSMKKSHCDFLKESMHRLSEFLVSLLADEMLSPHAYGPSESSEIRKVIANMTKELEYGKDLIDLCEVDYTETTTSSAPDENDPGVLRTPQKTENPRKTISQLQKRLEEETDKCRRLEKDYEVVLKERNMFAEDIKQLKSQSENTMSSLEGIIRDRSATLEAKESLIVELRRKAHDLERDYEQEKSRREKIQTALDDKFETLSKAASETSRTFEEQLNAAYDQIERKSIEIQSQKDTLRTADRQVASLKAANQALEGKCESLEKEVEKVLESVDQIYAEHAAKDALMESEYNATIAALKEDHLRDIDSLRKSRGDLDERNASLRKDVETDRKTAEAVLQSVKLKLAQTERDLQRSRTKCDSLEAQYRQRCVELETSLQEAKQRLSNERSSWEFGVRQAEDRAQSGFQNALYQRDLELREKLSVIDTLKKRVDEYKSTQLEKEILVRELRAEVDDLHIERKLLLEEIEHRRKAEELFQKEAENMTRAITTLRKAAEELQDSFDGADMENKSLREEVEQLSEKLRSRDIRIKELESKFKFSKVYATDGNESDDDLNQAREALLASANAEIDQLCMQMEAMHRTNKAQETELRELRETVSLRDETIRLKNATIESVTANREIEPLSSPGLSLTVTPIAPNRGNAFRQQSQDAVAAWMSQNASFTEGKNMLSSTLLELQEGVAATQERLRDLTNTARQYKQLAQLHLETLPVLHELERELFRISKKDPRQGKDLGLARGVVQSAIAQYYTTTEKQALLLDYNEALYEPSARRYAAMMGTVAELQRRRTGGLETVKKPPRLGEETSTNGNAACGSGVDAMVTQGTRRLLTFN
ncbi:WD40-repeat containing [Gracilaria domingensis]|nr:WD40-repeat containing [Gracilaria domingensis]